MERETRVESRLYYSCPAMHSSHLSPSRLSSLPSRFSCVFTCLPLLCFSLFCPPLAPPFSITYRQFILTVYRSDRERGTTFPFLYELVSPSDCIYCNSGANHRKAWSETSPQMGIQRRKHRSRKQGRTGSVQPRNPYIQSNSFGCSRSLKWTCPICCT